MAAELGRAQVIKGLPMLLHTAFQRKHTRAFTEPTVRSVSSKTACCFVTLKHQGHATLAGHQESCLANSKSSVTTCHYCHRTCDEGMTAKEL